MRKQYQIPILIAFFLLLGYSSPSQSVLQQGHWFKISVDKEGVYKITFEMLKKMGINPSEIDPRNLRIYGNEGGMLPQANNVARQSDLTERPVFISGETDGIFNKQDVIFFYASGPSKATYHLKENIFRYESNLYSDHNYYFLTVADQPGKRVSDSENIAIDAPVVTTFDDYVYHELDEHNELHSGREWYGEKFGLTSSLPLEFDVTGVIQGSEIKMVSDVMGQSYSSASFKLLFNGVQVAEQLIPPISNGRYSLKGVDRRDTVTINEAAVSASQIDKQAIVYEFVKGTGFSQGYLDYLLITFKRQLKRYDAQTVFSSAISLDNPISKFQVNDMEGTDLIWEVTDPTDAKNQPFDLQGSTATFSTTTTSLKKFIAFSADVPAAVLESRVENQNLHALSTPQLIIVTNEAFRAEADRLAAHRQNTKGWNVQVVSTEEVYNEFSSGRQDVTAIRDFVKHLYDKNPGALKAVLLFGKCSYDYKSRVQDNTNIVPTYESRNSLHPLQTYSSDDYFGFLDNDEGEWNETGVQNHSLDVGIGRLPVTDIGQARDVVDKLIAYDMNPGARGYWRKKIVFVADDGNSDDGFTSLHQYQADALATAIAGQEPGFDTRKIFMGTYHKTVKPNGETVSKMTDDIVRAFEDGALIINYTGHGSEHLWADERVFSNLIIPELRNDLFPFLVTATCEFGRHDDPNQTSSAELTILKKNAGAIGLVTTARPVNATTNFDLNKAFYEALFSRIDNAYPSLGEVFKATKNNSVSGVANRNFSLLADPSMDLALPDNKMIVTSVKTESGSDTLKALSRVIVKGFVTSPAGDKLSNFNGEAEATLYDKAAQISTIGRNNPAFSFTEWNNVLFRGKASVENGDFLFEFILPKNIAYSIDHGKLSLYARDRVGQDANGFSADFKIGGSEKAGFSDVTPPSISLFMGDTTFVNGGMTSADSYLVVRLSDESGVNISSYGIGNSIIATLDNDGETFLLNDHYVADTDDFRNGTIKYPMRNLTPGRHKLTLNAWDVHNNPGQASIDFIVTDGDEIHIETLGNYPNPFVDKTTIFFSHNRSGDDLEAQLFIYSSRGDLLEALEIPISQSEYKINLLEWGGSAKDDKKLPAGLYLARLVVRSLTNGSKNEQVTKLIILN